MKRLFMFSMLAHCHPAPAVTPPQIEKLLPALIQVESGGEYGAIGDGGKAVGILQITPIMVKDINRILGKEKYTLADRLDPEKSKEMARIYFNHYGGDWTVEEAARHWNAGPGRIAGTDSYWEKVKKEMERCQNTE